MHIGVAHDTWRSYVSRGNASAPKPVRHVGRTSPCGTPTKYANGTPSAPDEAAGDPSPDRPLLNAGRVERTRPPRTRTE